MTRLRALSWMLPILAAPAAACPFCNEGGIDTLSFVATFFGCFVVGMFLVVAHFARAGAFRPENDSSRSVLEAEGIFEAGEDHE